jgi:hypothetical protein
MSLAENLNPGSFMTSRHPFNGWRFDFLAVDSRYLLTSDDLKPNLNALHSGRRAG